MKELLKHYYENNSIPKTAFNRIDKYAAFFDIVVNDIKDGSDDLIICAVNFYTQIKNNVKITLKSILGSFIWYKPFTQLVKAFDFENTHINFKKQMLINKELDYTVCTIFNQSQRNWFKNLFCLAFDDAYWELFVNFAKGKSQSVFFEFELSK